ncbi:hypothetical protein [Actinokineospora enzanensis]|uniref:hypothetical protein n=1 Tax=Actinokineospora enzanensis TaxID=155975 RepID=UPI000372DE7E|nr:hypothetical protein [Actinokineospora enzanensis]
MVPDRREFMGLLAKTTMGATALAGADIAILGSPAATDTAAGGTEVEQLRDLTRVLWVQEGQLGGGAVRDTAIALVGRARGLLATTRSDDVRQLRGVLSDLLALAGWASHDIGLSEPALHYARQALAVAREADDPVRVALAMDQIGAVHLHQANHGDANEMFTLGIRSAAQARSGEATGLVLSSQARAYAVAGDAPRAIDGLARARDALATTSANLTEPRGFDHDLWSNESGRVLTVLADHDPAYAPKAIDALTAATAQPHPGRTKRFAFRLTDLATCHLRDGDPDTGIRLGHQVVDLAAHIRSKRLTEHLGRLRTAGLEQRGPDAVGLAQRIPIAYA